MFTHKQLELILGSLKQKLAILKDLYSGRWSELPEAVAELEELITEIEQEYGTRI